MTVTPGTGGMPVIRIPIPGLPDTCPTCGHESGEWPLSYGGYRVSLACPACHTLVGTLAAVRPEVSP